MSAYLRMLHEHVGMTSILFHIHRLPLIPFFMRKQQQYFRTVKRCAVVTNYTSVVHTVQKLLRSKSDGSVVVRFFTHGQQQCAYKFLHDICTNAK